MNKESFEWDEKKNFENQLKHGISFEEASLAFKDIKRIIATDDNHSDDEVRYFCFGKVDDGILTVRFTYRYNKPKLCNRAYRAFKK